MTPKRWQTLTKFREECAKIEAETGYFVCVYDIAHCIAETELSEKWVNDEAWISIKRPTGQPIGSLTATNFEGMRV